MTDPAQLASDELAAACKRCNGEASPDNIYSNGRHAGFRVFCEDCDNHGPLAPFKLAAVRAWNMEQAA